MGDLRSSIASTSLAIEGKATISPPGHSRNDEHSLTALWAGGAAFAPAAEKKWTMGEPIVTYWCGPVEALPQDVPLGDFGKSAQHPKQLVVVNLDFKKDATVLLRGPGRMQTFHAPTQTWTDGGESKSIKLELLPGGGALVRLRP